MLNIKIVFAFDLLNIFIYFVEVVDALNSCYSTHAFKPGSVDRETITSILEVTTREPSWANTQPREIFAAGGEALARLRQAYLENFHKGVPGKPDMPAPQQWPPALKKRMGKLGRNALKPPASTISGRNNNVSV